MSRRPDARSCGAVIYRKEASSPVYLLLRYKAGHWDFAKGHMEAGEGEEQTARREIAEETGIRAVTFLPGFERRLHYSYLRKGREAGKEVVLFLARADAPEDPVVLSHEHTDHAWLPYEEARKRLTYPNARRVLQAAHHHLLKQGVP